MALQHDWKSRGIRFIRVFGMVVVMRWLTRKDRLPIHHFARCQLVTRIGQGSLHFIPDGSTIVVVVGVVVVVAISIANLHMMFPIELGWDEYQ